MRISIRHQMIGPILFSLIFGLGTAALIGYKAIDGQGKISTEVNRALATKADASAVETSFRDCLAVVDRVVSMTTFVSAAEINASFTKADSALQMSLKDLKSSAVSSDMKKRADDLISAHEDWRRNTTIVLGLEKNPEVPTEEKLARTRANFSSKIEAVTALASSEATSSIDIAGQELSRTIATVLVAAGILAAFIATGLVLVANRLVKSILVITRTMADLASGNTEMHVSYRDRNDEIGSMAAAVEVFRQGAIAKKQLELESEVNRKQAEQDRITMQQRAEADASEKLRIATSGFAEGLKRLASGDLTVQLDDAFAGSFEALRHDFNHSVNQLSSTLTEISRSIIALDVGVREIADGTDDLSKRTERQAASLEETAASVEEISSNITLSARSTRDAQVMAKKANQATIDSEQVVSSAEMAMAKIQESSQQISNIIGLIDSIAFQTNLLALNAGVEAARAGEAGKGFAVVAQEVRELAQRSAFAAKEIKGLISNSSQEVDNGVKLVRDTGDALKTIGEFVVQINARMTDIAASSNEQATGIAEISEAINSMDQGTQQNAAMVEHSNAAAATMTAEAEKLRELVGQFRLNRVQAQNSRSQTNYAA